MFRIIKDVINNKDFKLETMLKKINKMYIEDMISEEEKSELDNLARSKAKAENSYDMQKQIDRLEERVRKLEEAKPTTEETTEEYLEFVQPVGAHDSYNTGDKITYNNKKYICKLDNCVWCPDVYPQGWEEVSESVVE